MPIGWRARDGHEDPRYQAMPSSAPGNRNAYALRRVYLPQGLVMFFVSLPVQVGMSATGGIGWLALLGFLLWLTGFAFETVGDWQLQQFKRATSRRGTVLDTGLWRYTRHPKHFGDAGVDWCVPDRRRFVARKPDSALASADGVDLSGEDGQAADGEGDVRAPTLPRVHRSHQRPYPPAAEAPLTKSSQRQVPF